MDNTKNIVYWEFFANSEIPGAFEKTEKYRYSRLEGAVYAHRTGAGTGRFGRAHDQRTG